MKFNAQVRLVENKKQKEERERAKELILEAFKILSTTDASVVDEAEKFLKEVQA